MLIRCRSMIQRSFICFAAIVLLCTSALIAKTPSQPNFSAVGGLKQYHVDSNKVGQGTCTLISPNWILTAWHVVKFKRNNPNGGKLRIIFRRNSVEREVDKVYKAPNIDVALCRLTQPMHEANTPPVALMDGKFLKIADGTITFTKVGRSTGLDYYRNRKGYGIDSGTSFYHSKSADGTRPGGAGDSGGAFLLERYCNYQHVQFSVIHGGGYGPQVGPLKDWIDSTIASTGDKATWVKKNVIKNWNSNDVGIPYPYKSTWDTLPDSGPGPEITMKAASACDDSGVEYYFSCLEDAAGDSGWQASNSYTDTNPIIGQKYTYTVKVRDLSANQNETEPSEPLSAISGMSNLSFELPAIGSGNSKLGIVGWYNSADTLTVDEGHADYPSTPYGENWAQMASRRWMYQKAGEWTENVNYNVTFLAGQTSAADFTSLYASMLVGGDPGLAQDDLDLLYQNENPLETRVGASILGISEVSPFAASGKATEEISLKFSTGTGHTSGSPLWIQFHNSNTGGITLVDNVSIREILMWVTGPADIAADLGSQVALYADTIGVDSFTWYKADDPGTPIVDGGDISGATTDTLTIDNAETADEGGYYCVLANWETTETSAVAQLTTNPMLESNPVDVVADLGTAVEFVVGSTIATDFAWHIYKDGVITQVVDGDGVSGATTPTLTIDPVEKADEGLYYCVVSYGADSEASVSAELATNPMLTASPANVAVDLLGTAEFTVGSTIATDFAWYEKSDPNNPLVDGGDISGATTPTLTIDNVDGLDIGRYYCVISFSVDSETSKSAKLKINSIVTAAPADTAVHLGEIAEFTVESPIATGFAWYKEGEPNVIVDGGDFLGATTATLTIVDVEASDDGLYYCVVSSDPYFIEEATPSAKLTVYRLIGHWKFEQDLEDEESDLFGEYVTSTGNPTAGPTYVKDADSIDGYAIRLNDDSKHIRVKGTNPQYDFYTSAFTVSAWVKIAPGQAKADATILSKHNGTKGYFLRVKADDGALFRLRTTGADPAATNTTINASDGQWHMVTGTFDGENMNLYIDGTIGNSATVTNSIATLTTPFIIGASKQNGGSPFEGLIDNVKIYNYALSNDDVIDAYDDAYRPVADAGEDIETYAWIDGMAVVEPNGLGSFDPNGDKISYRWSWEIGGEVFGANEIMPLISLPAGEHLLELVVFDGTYYSEPDSMIVTVIEAVDARTFVVPRVLNRTSRGNFVMAIVYLPDGVDKGDIVDGSFGLYVDGAVKGVPANRQRVIGAGNKGRMFVVFDRAAVIEAVAGQSAAKLYIAGELETGQCIYGEDTIRVVQAQRKTPRRTSGDRARRR